MKREILFRGKRVDNGEWTFGNYIRKNHPSYKQPQFWCSLIQDMALSTYEVIPETVGQLVKTFDGLRLFEGDICILSAEECLDNTHLNLDYDWSVKMTLVYNSENCAFWFVDKSGCVITFGDLDGVDAEIEVIGNIHDNLELT